MDAHSLYRLLERRFDGEMPEHLRRAALAGGESRLDTAAARAASRACDELALTAQRRAAASMTDVPLLPVWRAQGLAWHRRLASR
ncbi:MAG TPA: hypothetical protein VLA85_05855 [Verrucomicrobiae bacterium]|jgi:hypothetical protein|nr:hypothetical protein [Verrucomicrobiae bacterium]